MPTKTAFDTTPGDACVAEAAFALLCNADGVWYASGTAVAVATQLLVTAKHVVADYFERFEPTTKLRGELRTEIRVLARQVVKGVVHLWKVHKIWFSPITDVAYLLVLPASDSARQHKRWRVPTMQLVPPPLGARVVAFGFHSSRATPREDVSRTVEWYDEAATSVGEVVNVFPERRDSVMLPFPSFETNSRFDGGMSGGPIFNDAGEVCGIVCSSVHQAEDEPHSSFAALVWPSLATFVNIDLTGALSSDRLRVLALAQAGILNMSGAERLQVVDDTGELKIRLALP